MRYPSTNSDWPPQIAQTPFCVTAVKFSHNIPSLLAVGTGQNFGIAGKGCQHVYSVSRNAESPTLRASYLCDQTVLDCAWSEEISSVLGAALGDGCVNLWDVRQEKLNPHQFSPPLQILKGHSRECFSLEWNLHLPHLLLTASWDLSVRLWDVPTGLELLCLPGVHQQAVYKAAWCPLQSSILATCGGDGCMRILDVRENAGRTNPSSSSFLAKSLATQFAHEGEALAVDWNKFSPFVIATSGTDNVIRLWDIRKLQASNKTSSTPFEGCLESLRGHSLAVRCIQWSPIREAVLASGSYDMTVGVWDCRRAALQHRYSHHSEFVVGLDWNIFADGVLSSASWDGSFGVWDCLRGSGPVQLKKKF
ncbi:uncharacterized protein LOC129617459 [Condylostylus longicornis]|uniref:uncharacterized protein LOC129617459 n=1 Tax=Condylostylus longicornis TaxID=2530218 RepID=UPI00244E5788|nr:uncharacterized protein LOC129617459 [Condylostylus longicornis]